MDEIVRRAHHRAQQITVILRHLRYSIVHELGE
jgi:hypothetical protein